jgi:hypothetical protein
MNFQTIIGCIVPRMLNLKKRAAETLQDVSSASKKIEETADWAAIALCVVAGVAAVALLTAVIALERASYER